MAAKQFYPRATIRKIVKSHLGRPVGKNVDVLIFLDYMLFLQELVKEASIQARQSGEKSISARHIRRVRETCLRKFRG